MARFLRAEYLKDLVLLAILTGLLCIAGNEVVLRPRTEQLEAGNKRLSELIKLRDRCLEIRDSVESSRKRVEVQEKQGQRVSRHLMSDIHNKVEFFRKWKQVADSIPGLKVAPSVSGAGVSPLEQLIPNEKREVLDHKKWLNREFPEVVFGKDDLVTRETTLSILRLTEPIEFSGSDASVYEFIRKIQSMDLFIQVTDFEARICPAEPGRICGNLTVSTLTFPAAVSDSGSL